MIIILICKRTKLSITAKKSFALEAKDFFIDKFITFNKFPSITCGQGRTIEQKKKLHQSIAEGLHTDLDLSTNNIFITVNETTLENWSFGQGIAQMVNQKEEK